MKRFILIFLLFAGCLSETRSQNPHFIYIQSDDNQPFYVRLKEKVVSSSENGYVILPEMQEGSVDFTIGFPKNRWSAINYNVDIENKDLGFQLRKIDTATWALYNLQSAELLSAKVSAASPAYIIQNNNDEFSNILAEVSNTPSVKQTRISTDSSETVSVRPRTDVPASKEEKQPMQPEVADNKTVAVVSGEPAEKVQENIQESKSVVRYQPSIIRQAFSFLDNTGRSLTYEVIDSDKTEKVVVFISYEKDLSGLIETLKKQGQKKPEIEAPVIPAVSAQQTTSDTAVTETIVETATNKFCKKMADQQDFIRLRRKMAQEDSEEKMTEVATVAFSDQCYTTEQVRNLAVLYLNDASRLEFLKVSVSHISDKQNFNTLQDLFKTEAGISGFRDISY